MAEPLSHTKSCGQVDLLKFGVAMEIDSWGVCLYRSNGFGIQASRYYKQLTKLWMQDER